jgi:hypothetical protein
MKKWRIFKYTLLVILGVGGICLAYAAYQVYDRICWFGLEDQISHHLELQETIDSIKQYVKDNQQPPETFSPSVDLSDIHGIKDFEVDYHVIADRHAWRLDVYVKARGEVRQFVYVSDGQLTDEEKNRYYIWCHDWHVLKVPENKTLTF